MRVWLECLWCVLPSKCVQCEAELILKASPRFPDWAAYEIDELIPLYVTEEQMSILVLK